LSRRKRLGSLILEHLIHSTAGTLAGDGVIDVVVEIEDRTRLPAHDDLSMGEWLSGEGHRGSLDAGEMPARGRVRPTVAGSPASRRARWLFHTCIRGITVDSSWQSTGRGRERQNVIHDEG